MLSSAKANNGGGGRRGGLSDTPREMEGFDLLIVGKE